MDESSSPQWCLVLGQVAGLSHPLLTQCGLSWKVHDLQWELFSTAEQTLKELTGRGWLFLVLPTSGKQVLPQRGIGASQNLAHMVSRWDWAKPVRLPLGTLWSNQSKNFIHYLCVSWITGCINVKSESTKWHWLEAMSCSESHVWGGDWCARLCRECSWDHKLWERKEGRQQGGRRRQPRCRPTPWGALKLAQAFLLLHKNKSLDMGPWEEDVVMLRCHFSSEAILIWADSWGSCRDSPAVLTGPLRDPPPPLWVIPLEVYRARSG